MRRAARVDKNQPELVKAFRELGCSVAHLHNVGKGKPDTIIGAYGLNYLVEIKGEKGKLTPDQEKWHDEWRGQACIIRNEEEARALVSLMWEQSCRLFGEIKKHGNK